MTSVVHRGYLVVMAAAVAVYFGVADSPVATALYEVITLAGLGTAALAVTRAGPARPATWWLLVAGAGLTAAGDVVWALLRVVWRDESSPSLADVCYLGSYPVLAAGLLVLIRTRSARRDGAGLLDALIVASGLGVVFWVFVIVPAAGGADLTTGQRLFTAAYPVADLLLLALVARLVTTPGARTGAYWLLVGSLLSNLLADTGYAVSTVVLGQEEPSVWLDLGWMLFPVLLGAAALHPTMSTLAVPSPVPETGLSRWRLLVLASASLLAPATQIAGAVSGSHEDVVATAIASAVLFGLVLLRVAGLLERVRAQAVLLDTLAHSDGLTGLANRRTWDAELTLACARAQREGSPMSVALLDLDHFKAYNDAHGHQAGDEVLRAASIGWGSRVSTVDLLARYGGEEFGVLLPGCDLADAAQLVEQLRVVTPGEQTVSAGVAQWDGAEEPEALVARCDQALYRAKRAGRDRVVTAVGVPA